MSNPTTPFNWQMPTNTDLVTDLPADFEVFGQAVATSMADLLGGTTGQILSKNSNTDMDFVWIANDQGDITGITATSPLTGGGSSGAITVGIQDASTSQKGSVQLSDSTSTTSSVLAATPTAVKSSYDLAAAAIPKSTVTTSGDVIYATGSSAVTRLGIGTTGQILTVAGGVPSWATPSASASGMTKIAASTFSAISSVNIDSLFSSTYKSYMMTLNCTSSATGALNMQMRYGTTTVTSADYYGAGWQLERNGTTSTWGASGTTTRAIVPELGGQSTITIFFNNVGNASAVASWFVTGTWGSQQNSGHGSGLCNVAQTYTGIALATSTGNITGNYQVYGLAI